MVQDLVKLTLKQTQSALGLVSLNVTVKEMPSVLELGLESKAVASVLVLEEFSPDQSDELELLNALDLVAVSTLEFQLALALELEMQRSLMELAKVLEKALGSA